MAYLPEYNKITAEEVEFYYRNEKPFKVVTPGVLKGFTRVSILEYDSEKKTPWGCGTIKLLNLDDPGRKPITHAFEQVAVHVAPKQRNKKTTRKRQRKPGRDNGKVEGKSSLTRSRKRKRKRNV